MWNQKNNFNIPDLFPFQKENWLFIFIGGEIQVPHSSTHEESDCVWQYLRENENLSSK